ncbi:MAG: MFS transporter, partial [Acidimicrobiaceae bacterium]|nr:MFS transporter [Acidimicrobiaceae bacterium]
VIGGLVAAGRRQGGPRRLVNTALAFGVVIGLAALAPTRWAEQVILLAVGAGSVTFLSLGNSTLQLRADPAMRGRVMSLWSVAFMGSTPVGGPLVGFIGGDLGPRYALGIGALAALVAAAYGYVRFGHQNAPDAPVLTEQAGSSLPGRAHPGPARPDGPQRLPAPARAN